MRVVIAEDEALMREGLAGLLTAAGLDVVGRGGTPDELLVQVARLEPDAAIVDIRMPPTHTDEGLVAAERIRDDHPAVAVLVLSNYLESRYAMRLLQDHPESVGYLLKERVSDVAVLVDALRRITDGECVLDPTIVKRLVTRPREPGPLSELTEREREVLGLIAEGHSNQAISARLFLSQKTVETHLGRIYDKVGVRSRAALATILAADGYAPATESRTRARATY